MAKNKLSDLRDHLFETLEALKDEEHPMDIARARAIAGIAQTIINSATVEVKAINALGREDNPGDFFSGGKEAARALPAAAPEPTNQQHARQVVDPLRTVKAKPRPNSHA
jgi:hypothetical protein